MLSRSAFALLAIALPLAACSSEPEVSAENASVGEVANKVAEAGGPGKFVRPGKWDAKVTLEEMTIPGMPPEAAERMKGFAGRAEGYQSCLTAEEAERPKEDFFAGASKNCRYERFTMGGGKIDAVMKCAEGASSQEMQMAGTYSPDSYNMAMTTTTSGSGPQAGMKMKMRIDAKRIGECDATEKS
jgi:hypothetical protein